MALNVFNEKVLDPIINDGAVVTVLFIILGGVFSFLYKTIKGEIIALKTRVGKIEEQSAQHTLDLTKVSDEIRADFNLLREQIKELKKDLEPINNVLNKLLERQILK